MRMSLYIIAGLFSLTPLACQESIVRTADIPPKSIACTLEYPSVQGFLYKIKNNPACANLMYVKGKIDGMHRRLDEISTKKNLSEQDFQQEIDRMEQEINTLLEINEVAANQIKEKEPIGLGSKPAKLTDIDKLNKQLDSLKKQINSLSS